MSSQNTAKVQKVQKTQKKVKSIKTNTEDFGRFVKQFKHWRSGKIIKAEDYGLKAFPIGNKKKSS